SGRSPGSPSSRRRRWPHFRQLTSTRIVGRGWSAAGRGGAFLHALCGGEKGLARAGGQHADGNLLRHPLALLHDERRPYETTLAIWRCLQFVVSVVEAQVACERGEVDLSLLRIERLLHLGVRLSPDHPLRDLHCPRAPVDGEDLRPIDAGDEVE